MPQPDPTLRDRHWGQGFCWAALALLVIGLPQCSPLVDKAMTLIPLSNRPNNGIAISFAIHGVSTAVAFASGLVILAAILLRAGSGWKRLLLAAGYVAIHCLVTGLVLALTQSRWMQHAMQEESAYLHMIAELFLSPAMSFASVFPAAVMQLFRGWTITRGWPESKLQRVNVLALMEWVLVSALIFTFVRLSFVANDQSNVDVFFYEALMVMLPAIGLGIVTMLLFRWILCVDASPRRFLILLIIALIHVSVFAACFIALQAEDDAIGPNLNLQYSIAPLSTCATGTLIAAAAVGCLRKLGYRLHTSGTR